MTDHDPDHDPDPTLDDALDGLVAASAYCDDQGWHELAKEIAALYQETATRSVTENPEDWSEPSVDFITKDEYDHEHDEE